MSAAAVAAGAMAVESQNIVGVDNSFSGGDGFNFCTAPFTSVGYNTADIQDISIPGAEWEGITFAIWEGGPDVRAGSQATYFDAGNDPLGEATEAYWGDDEYDKVSYSIEAGQGFVFEGLNGYTLQFAGQVPEGETSITAGEGFNFFGNPFPEAIDIQAISIPGAEWEGITFAIWEGGPDVRAGSQATYFDAGNDPLAEATEAYWGDDEYNKVSYSIDVGQSFVLEGANGYTINIAPPYSL